MVWLRFIFLGGWLLAGSAVSSATTGPVALTLINGVTLTGTVSSLSASGVVVTVGSSSRAYPWAMLAPGTRYRYDGHFRMNLEGFLEGAASASLTNAPDALYDPFRAEVAAETEAAVAESSPVSLTNLVWRAGGVPIPSSVRGLASAVAGGARFAGLRLGTGPEDVVVVGWETGKAARVTAMPVRGAAVVHRVGQGAWASDPQVIPVSVGDASGTASVSWRLGATGAWPPEAVIAYRIERDGQSVEWVVRGLVFGWRGADEPVMAPMVLDRPRLDLLVVLSPTAGAGIAWELSMGRWRLEPGAGMGDHVALELRDALGARVAGDRIAVASRVAWPLARLEMGAGYEVSGSFDLGAGLGRVEGRRAFTMPDPFQR
ncbi:MAG TPA: hypothetical protein PKC67_07130 [Kiritimatiellia bacterium]|nr:hypothetical protein [Kiritimatiellia bacterium]HMP34110.1 hypothetical protein [Kiritimatiellia bacterium]